MPVGMVKVAANSIDEFLNGEVPIVVFYWLYQDNIQSSLLIHKSDKLTQTNADLLHHKRRVMALV